MKNLLIILLSIFCCMPAYADNFSDSNTVFDWAENMYPQFFGQSGTETTQLQGYLVRYYSGTDTYIGTMGEDVYVYGTEFNGLQKVGSISDFIQTDNLRFTHELLDGETLYNVYYEDDENEWDLCAFSFGATAMTSVENGQTATGTYSLTTEGYLFSEDPDTEEGEEAGYNFIKITEKTVDYLTIAWEDSIEDARNAEHGEEFFFFDQQKALDFQSRKNAQIAATTPEKFVFTSDWLNGKTLYLVNYDDLGNEVLGKRWITAKYEFANGIGYYSELTSEDPAVYTCTYSLTDAGNIVWTFPVEGEDTFIQYIKPIELETEFLNIFVTDDVEELTHEVSSNNAYYYFDLQKALDSTQNRNEDLMISNALFNWAENVYPEYFDAAGAQTYISAGNLTRHYQATNNYIRTSNGEVSVEGEIFGGDINLGNISNFISATANEFSYELIENKTLFSFINANFHININDDGSYDGENAMEQDFFGDWELVDGNLVLTPDANCTICNGVSTMNLRQGYTFTDGKTLLFIDRNDGEAYPLFWVE